MEGIVNPARCCPECASKDYVFRGRKKITAEADQPPAMETKYACRGCGHTWKERVTVKAGGAGTRVGIGWSRRVGHATGINLVGDPSRARRLLRSGVQPQ
jgi:hypothetical protein